MSHILKKSIHIGMWILTFFSNQQSVCLVSFGTFSETLWDKMKHASESRVFILFTFDNICWHGHACVPKVNVLKLSWFGWLLLLVSKSVVIELALCWDSRAFERFADFYLALFLLFLSVKLQWHRTIWVGLCTSERVLFHFSRSFEISIGFSLRGFSSTAMTL